MGIFDRWAKNKTEEIVDLKNSCNLKDEEILRLKDEIATNDNKILEIRTSHRIAMDDLKTEHQVELNTKANEVFTLKETLDARVEKEVSPIKKELKIKGEKQDAEHATRMKKLESDYALKIAKCDRDLETDKASYRKYLRQEMNSKIEHLEKDNDRLSKENARLIGENMGLTRTSALFEGQLEKLGDVVDSIVDALPSVEVNMSTPEVTVNLPKAEQKGGNNEQKKS